MPLKAKDEKDIKIRFWNTRENIDYFIKKLPLKNRIGEPIERDCEIFHIRYHDLKTLDDNHYTVFLDLLFSYPLFKLFDVSESESEVDEAIFNSACLLDAGGGRDFLKHSSSKFNYKIRLIRWFINRGNFNIATKIITFHEYQITSKILLFMLSPVFQVPMFLGVTIGLVCDFYTQYIFIGLLLVFSFYVLISIWVRFKDPRFQFLLLAELLPAKVAIASVAAHVVIFSSDQLINILAISDPVRSCAFVGFSIFLTIVAINYHLLKIPISAKESIFRSTVATIHFFWFSFLANIFIHLVWFLNIDQWNLAETYLGHADKIYIAEFYSGIVVFPALLVNTNSLCILFSVLLNQVINDKTIA